MRCCLINLFTGRSFQICSTRIPGREGHALLFRANKKMYVLGGGELPVNVSPRKKYCLCKIWSMKHGVFLEGGNWWVALFTVGRHLKFLLQSLVTRNCFFRLSSTCPHKRSPKFFRLRPPPSKKKTAIRELAGPNFQINFFIDLFIKTGLRKIHKLKKHFNKKTYGRIHNPSTKNKSLSIFMIE